MPATTEKRLLRPAWGEEDGLRRRDSEGVPQTCAQVSSGRQSGRQGAEEKFKQILEANDVLSDPKKRKVSTRSATTGQHRSGDRRSLCARAARWIWPAARRGRSRCARRAGRFRGLRFLGHLQRWWRTATAGRADRSATSSACSADNGRRHGAGRSGAGHRS